jgi:shikimate dehydrogenase
MKKACVIGSPISHSRSPLIHNYWLSRYGIAGSYERIAVAPADLEKFFARIRSGEFIGCNITLPHKESAIAYLDQVEEEARISGSVNTIYWEGTDLVGTSTDGMGFADNVTATVKGFAWAGQKVLVLGAGGSARAIIAGLLQRKVREIRVWNRTEQRAETLSQQFGEEVSAVNRDALVDAARKADVIINTTSAGFAGTPPLDFPFDEISQRKVVADIVYVPLITSFLQQARACGHIIVPGLGMLLHQAVPGFEKWFGHRPEVTQELHDLVARDIEKGQHQ